MELAKRKSPRLTDYDYSENGAYFITICSHNRRCIFGVIDDGVMKLNEYGLIVEKHIGILSSLNKDVKIDNYVIMPNHVHLLISICRERISCGPLVDRTKMMISKLVQSFKSSVTKDIRKAKERSAYNALPTVVWQDTFHDHVIRNENTYEEIWQYIDNNPAKWFEDCHYCK